MQYILKRIVPQHTEKNFFLFWCVQPVLLFEWVGNGHFDVVWIAALLLAIVFGLQRRWWLTWICLVVSIWIKFIPLLVAPWFLIWWWQDIRGQWLKIGVQVCIGIFESVVGTYLAWLHFWAGFKVFEPLVLQSKWAVSSIFSIFYYSLFPLFQTFLHENTHWFLTRAVQGVLVIIVYYMLFPYVKKFLLTLFKKDTFDTPQVIQAILITLATYLCIWQKSIWPWYIAWLLPFGILLQGMIKNRLLERAVRWFSIGPFVFYMLWLPPWLFGKTDSTPELWFFYAFIGIAVIYPLISLVQWRRHNFA